jgi:hypothetical protein
VRRGGGPIDYLVAEFPGNRMNGQAFPLLLDLADRKLIRILDLAFVRKELDGQVIAESPGRLAWPALPPCPIASEFEMQKARILNS